MLRVGFLERAEQLAQVVATEVAEQARQVRVRGARHGSGQVLLLVGGRAADQPFASGLAGQAHQVLVFLVEHVVDAAAQGRAAASGEGRFETPTVLGLDHLPADAAEQGFHLLHLDAGDHAVQTLAIQVDDPQHVAQARAADGFVADGLPDIAFVQLGVADDGDEAARWVGLVGAEVGGGVAIGERGEQRRGGAEADGAGGEVDRVGVLGATRVGLQAAEGAQCAR